MSQNDSYYLHHFNLDVSRYEVVSLEPEDDPLPEELYPSMESAVSVPIENVLGQFRILRATVISPSKVRDYLYRNPELVELLQYVVNLVYIHFDSDMQLSLEIYHDKETQYESLTLYIRQYVYDENIIKMIKEIRREYRQVFPETRGRFLLTTDFHLPR